MVSGLDDVTVLHHDDDVGAAYRRETVRHNEARAPLHHLSERALYLHLGSGIDGGGRFVENQHRRQAEHDARYAKKLPLSL